MTIALEDKEDEQQQHTKRIRASHSSETLEDPLSVPALLPEIIVQILYLLPVKSLLRCKSVCKLWYSMISDPHFVKSHLTLSTNNSSYAHHRLIYRNLGRQTLNSGLLYDVMYDGSSKAIELDHPLESRLVFDPIAVSCDGLFLLQEYREDELLIWNPSTRKSNRVRLPYRDFKVSFDWSVLYGLGYDVSTDDYKVVAVYDIDRDGDNYDTEVEICSLKTGNWKNIGEFPHDMWHLHSCKFCNGAMHWAGSQDFGSSNSWTIVSLLLEKFCNLCTMKVTHLENWGFWENGCECFVIKEYGVKDSWTKLVSIPYLTDPGDVRYSVPLCITNDGKVLLQFGAKWVVYDSKNQSFSEIQNCDECSTVYTFVESLVSPS